MAAPRLRDAVNATAHAAFKLCRSPPCATAGLAWTAGAGKWRSMKRRGLVAKLTDHFADDQIIALARFGDANLSNCSHRYTVKRPKIADDSTTIPGLAFNARGRAIGPRTFTRTWIFLGGSFFRPLERRPYDLAPLGSKRV